MYTYIVMSVTRAGMFAVESNHDLEEIQRRLVEYNETYKYNILALVFACEGPLLYQQEFTTKQYIVSFKSFEAYVEHMLWELTRFSIERHTSAQHTKLRLLAGEEVLVKPRAGTPRVNVTLEECQDRIDRSMNECEHFMGIVDALCDMFNVYLDLKKTLQNLMAQSTFRFQESLERMIRKNAEKRGAMKTHQPPVSNNQGE